MFNRRVKQAVWAAGGLFAAVGVIFGESFIADVLELFIGNWDRPLCVFAWHLESNLALLAGLPFVFGPLMLFSTGFFIWHAGKKGGFSWWHYAFMGITAFHLATIMTLMVSGGPCWGVRGQIPF